MADQQNQKDARDKLDQDLAELARAAGGTLHTYPRPGRAVRRIILRDLRTDGGSQFESAQLEDDGTLRINGSKHSGTPSAAATTTFSPRSRLTTINTAAGSAAC